MLFFTLVLLLSAVPALGQTLNRWRQTVFGIGGSPGHSGDDALDYNPKTYAKVPGLPTSFAILLNTWDHYLGFYIQSSGSSYITDYYVEAYNSAEGTMDIVGRVSGATSNFTAVNFYNTEGEPEVWTYTMYLYVTGIHGLNSTANSSAIINEIYPIYRDDTIIYPPGQSASPSPTQPVTSTPTPTPSPTIPTPSAPGLVLNPWDSGHRQPFPIGGSNSSALTDRDPATGSSQTLVTSMGYPARYSILFNLASSYAGLYILSESPNYLTDYHVEAQNIVTHQSFEVCRVTSASSNFTVCPFINEDGDPYFNTYTITIFPHAVNGGGDTVGIQEIYPIYPRDTIVYP